MPDDKNDKKKLMRRIKGKEKSSSKKSSNLASNLIYTILHFRDIPQAPLITFTMQFIFLAGGYDNMDADGYEGTNFAFGLKFKENAPHKKIPYGIKRVATVLDEENKNVPAGEEWELGEWKKNGVKLLNTRDPDTSSYLYHTLKGSGTVNNPIFIAIFGKQNERLIPRKLAPEHKIFIYQHPTSREPVEGEAKLESLATDLTKFTEDNVLPNNWFIGKK